LRGSLNPPNPLSYSQLTQQQRTRFEILKKLGTRIVEISHDLGVHFSTLYRENRRNREKTGDYDSFQAEQLAQSRKAIPRRPTKCTPENKILVRRQLEEDFSPDVMAGRAKYTGKGPALSTSTIYKLIEKDRDQGGKMYQKLARRGRRYRKNRTGAPGKGRGKLKVLAGQELKHRPQGINERNEPGHLEIDLMFSGETVWLTGVDRYTRKLSLVALPSKESEPIADEVYLWLESGKIRSITTDRGLEWSDLNPWVMDLLKKKLNLYFCQPYSSWEKGSIENMNRLLRRYFPKGKTLPWDEGNKELAARIEDKMNRRPRKILGYRTPQEVDQEWNLTRRRAAWKKTMAGGAKEAA
jgi:transposase, IS30 family